MSFWRPTMVKTLLRPVRMYCDAISPGSQEVVLRTSLVLFFGNQISATHFPQCCCLNKVSLTSGRACFNGTGFVPQLKPLPSVSIGDRISEIDGFAVLFHDYTLFSIQETGEVF
nr:hypothetical protein Iba_chr10aCG15270 [Ipomoea batatas]